MSLVNTLFTVILLVGVVIGGYLLYHELNASPDKIIQLNEPSSPTLPAPTQEKSKQFYPNLRFKDRVITYKFDPRCTEAKENQMAQTFKLFEDRTVVSFTETSGDPDLYIACSELAPEPEAAGHFVAGEGGPTRILNGTLYTIILESKISLYEEEQCSEPHIAVHELLHVFGFDHNNDRTSILYPTLDCAQVYNSYFFERINELYAADSLPDLVPSNITLSKAGRYIEFTIDVSNQGLDLAKNIQLGLYADNKIVDTFDLGDIDIGTKKVFTVRNLRVTSGASQLEFRVDPENAQSELSESNNNAAFSIERS